MEGYVPWPEKLARDYEEKGYWPGLTVGQTFDQTAAKYPDRKILVSEEVRFSYSEVCLYANRLALSLLELGIKKGDMLVLMLPNGPALVFLYIALAKIGAIGVWALPQHRQREILYLVEKTGAVGIAVPDHFRKFDYMPMIEELQNQFQNLTHILVAGKNIPKGTVSFQTLLDNPIEQKYPPNYLNSLTPDANDVLCLLLTGGTTALPKIVPRTHNSMLLASLDGAIHRGHNSPEAVYLLNNHISHGAGMQRLTGCLVQNGAKVVLRKRPVPEDMLQAIKAEKVTHTGMVPTMALDLINHPNFENYDLGSLKSMDLPGARATAELLKALKSKLPHCSLHIAFGSNEGMMLSSRPGDTFEMVCEGAIRPISEGDEIKIIDDNGNEVPDGVVGEIIARGPNVTRGYYKSPELNQSAFDSEGFWHPGDLFVKHKDGTFRAMGRRDDMIIRGGENISAKEIEELLTGHPGVDAVAVVAMPDIRLGQRACAYVTLRTGEPFSFEDMQAFLKEKDVTKFKWPERLEIIGEFPLTHIGKVSKKDLREDIIRKLNKEGKP